MRKFEFKKSYEEVEINGKVYKIYFSDEQIKKYQKAFNEFYGNVQSLINVDAKNIKVGEEEKLLEQSKDVLKKVIEIILGEGTFEKIYEDAGKSVLNVAELIAFLSDIVGERTKAIREERMNKYTKNKGKRK